jgi:hypothetical protein
LIRRHQEYIPPKPAPSARYDAVVLEIKKDLLEEFAGDLLLFSDLGDHQGIVGAGKRHKRPQGVSGFLGDHCLGR